MTRRLPAALALALAALALALAALALPAPAEEAPGKETPAAEPAKPAVVRVDAHTMRIGEVTFRPESREIRIPTRVNMTAGLLEFVLVHVNGKVHESLLVTEANATHLNIALKLLRYQPSEELFRLLEDDGSVSDKYPEVPAATRAAARVRLAVEWKEGQESKSAPLHEWIASAVTERPMPEPPWVYGGSYVLEGRFAAETSGDIIATFVTRNALINYGGKDNEDDEAWIPAPRRVPPEGTPVTVVISPAQTNRPAPPEP